MAGFTAQIAEEALIHLAKTTTVENASAVYHTLSEYLRTYDKETRDDVFLLVAMSLGVKALQLGVEELGWHPGKVLRRASYEVGKLASWVE